MRHWILSFFFLISAKLLIACGGWYPFGEEVRFSLLHPQLFDDGGMLPFYYSADYIYDSYEHTSSSDRNVDDWYRFAQGKVSKEDVFNAVYRLTAKEILDKGSKDPFVVQLMKQGSVEELKYLAFAKRYSHLNTVWDDPWERGDDQIDKKRATAMKKALKLSKQASNSELKRRYAFQALRFAYYNHDPRKVKQLYESYFEGHSELVIDKWATYFFIHQQESSNERNFALTQLFADIPSKRFGIFTLFDWEASKDEIMAFATTDKERANVIAMYAIRRQDRSLSVLKEIHQLDPNNSLLAFLMIRELNKVEDWVLGPIYTTYAPVMRPGMNAYSADQQLIRAAAQEDQLYAKELLSWLNQNKTLFSGDLYQSVAATLEFCVDDHQAAYNRLKGVTFQSPEREDWRKHMLGMLKIANGGDLGSIDLERFLKTNYAFKDRFIFMLGRLFEYRDELGNAALLYSQLNNDREDWTWFTWAEPRGYATYNISFYYDYFDYFDANYTADQLSEVLAYAKKVHASNSNKPLGALSEKILKDEIRLKDLIGTKYLREDNLKQSIVWLKQVPETYWESDDRAYAHFLGANPFYAHFYSEHAKTEGDTIHYTKYEIAKQLYDMLEKAKLQQGNEKANTLYHIANCYFNMTSYGNSWMMRRSWWSTNVYNTIYVDNDEFNKCLKAEAYYMKAYEASNSEKVKALCLRMAGRCESYRIYFEEEYDYDFDYDQVGGYDEYLFNKNTLYKRLKREFPQYERELITNCYSFNRFYKSI